MKLRKNHWSLWLIKAMTGKATLPNSRCEYFRKLIYSAFTGILILPFTIYVAIVAILNIDVRENPHRRDFPPGTFLFWMALGMFFVTIFSDHGEFAGWYEWSYALENIYWLLPVMMISVAVAIGAIIGVLFLCVQLFELIEKALSKKNKNPRPYWSEYPSEEEYQEALKDWRIHQEYLQEKRESTLGYAIKEWWKTRKEKVCPMIEYIEEDGIKN